MFYRLYASNSEERIYQILASYDVDKKTIALVYNANQFIVAHGLHFDVCNSVHWCHGHYFTDLIEAMEKYVSYCSTTIALVWSVEDVLQVRKDLTEEQAQSVLQQLKEGHDAEIGVNWGVVEKTINDMYPRFERG